MRIDINKIAIAKAFEELGEGEAKMKKLSNRQREQLEAEAKDFQTLKTNLNLLKDIPDCQVTAEHLRTRILAEGIHSQPAKDWSIYEATGTAAVSCLVLGFVWLTHGSAVVIPQMAPTVVKSTSASQPPPLFSEPSNSVHSEIVASASAQKEKSTPSLKHHEGDQSDSHSQMLPITGGSQLVALNSGSSVDPRTSIDVPQPRNGANLGYRHGFGSASNPASELTAPAFGLASPPLMAASEASYNAIKNGTLGKSRFAKQTNSSTLITLQSQRDKRTGLIEAKEEPNNNDVPLGG